MKNNKKYTVLVTGGCGFIGSHIVDRLISDSYEVVIIDDLSTGSLDKLNTAAIFYQGDVCDDYFVNKIFYSINEELPIECTVQNKFKYFILIEC